MFDLLFANILGLYNIKRFLGGKDFDICYLAYYLKKEKKLQWIISYIAS